MADAASSANTSIPVVSSERPDNRRHAPRGRDAVVLERGVDAKEQIHAAHIRAHAYWNELESARARLAQYEDQFRDYNARLRITGVRAIPPPTPPDPLTAEILKRDTQIARWTESYERLVDSSARERTELKRSLERAQRALAIAKDDYNRLETKYIRIRNRADDQERDGAGHRRQSSPDPALAPALRERDDLRSQRDEMRVELEQLQRAQANDRSWFDRRANEVRARELEALRQGVLLQRQIDDLQGRLQHCGVGSEAGSIHSAGVHHSPGAPTSPFPAHPDGRGPDYLPYIHTLFDSPPDVQPDITAADGSPSPSADFSQRDCDHSPSSSASSSVSGKRRPHP